MTESRAKPWLTYSIRSLLLVLFLVALGLGFMVNRANRQLQTLAAIKSVGGDYRLRRNNQGWSSQWLQRWFGEEAFDEVLSVNLRGTDAGDDLVTRLGKLKGLQELDLSGTQTTDAGVLRISQQPLRVLWLQECPISDESGRILSKVKTLKRLLVNGATCSDRFVENLGELPELKDLGLRGTGVTSEALKQVVLFPKLEKLYLYSTVVDDHGMQFLRNNNSIKILDLSSTRVTDDSFQVFQTLGNLKELDLNACRSISRAAADQFAAQSKCRVRCNSRH